MARLPYRDRADLAPANQDLLDRNINLYRQQHIKIGHEFGVTDADIDALIADSQGMPAALPPLDRLVLLAARQSTAEGRIAPETFDRLRAELGESALMDLVVIVSSYAGVVWVRASVEVDVEPEYQPYLDRFPLPR